jgi:hypothetical protein
LAEQRLDRYAEDVHLASIQHVSSVDDGFPHPTLSQRERDLMGTDRADW